MKRFRLQCGAVVKVDDCDAYLLRTYVWRVHKHDNGDGAFSLEVIRGSHGQNPTLPRYITGSTAEVLDHINDDRLDCTRANLREMTRSEWVMEKVAHKMSASMVEYNKSRRLSK